MGGGSGFLCGHYCGMADRFLAFIQKKRKLQFLPPAHLAGSHGRCLDSPALSPLRSELSRNFSRVWNGICRPDVQEGVGVQVRHLEKARVVAGSKSAKECGTLYKREREKCMWVGGLVWLWVCDGRRVNVSLSHTNAHLLLIDPPFSGTPKPRYSRCGLIFLSQGGAPGCVSAWRRVWGEGSQQGPGPGFGT